MATTKPKKTPASGTKATSWLPSLRGSAADLKARAAEDAAQRRAAGASPRSVILNAKDVQGDYDISRLLTTTLGGNIRDKPRMMTHDDLAAFRHNVRQVQARYTDGIRARQVLDLSLPIDRERANKEIRTAVPVMANGARVRFLTNAGPDSDVTHHHVQVEFLAYASAASGARGDAKKSAAWLKTQPLKIECDCGRWRYWYRYVATIGRYNGGRDETGYPKIRNPGLYGVACKHIIRTMAEVESSGTVQGFLTRLIEKARAKDDNAVRVQTSQKQAQELASKPASRVRDVEATMRRRQQAKEKAALTRAAKAQQAKNQQQPTVTPVPGAGPAPVPPPTTKRASTATRRAVKDSADTLAQQFGMTREQVLRLLSAASKKKE